jgi:hypothetical protein
MTWTINVTGHDDLTGDEKAAYEQDVVDKAKALVAELAAKDGGHVSAAQATTNTTGSVNLSA